ncbi:anthranilate phosphoribosyltransferase [Sulfobacillus thermosulfidooxidans]|uniref:anthranilate phosphoribosyltransferase n=1 Tax=Sulfobacillus thermosulfidooxidans TaxID=28034 RepID=UPI0006B41975|nr:hypothetical protein [Sulfobacillus thermosulfidooxidans]
MRTVELQFSDLLKEIARGRKGSRDLTLEEAHLAARYIIENKATPAQIGAFLASERIKTESSEELFAFSNALRLHVVTLNSDSGRIVQGLDAAGPFDGRQNSFFATIPAALIVRAAGVPILLHGVKSPLPPKKGTGLFDVLTALHLPLGTSAQDIQCTYQQLGISFLDVEAVCAPLRRLRPIREELYFRTLLNTVEKTLNPANHARLIIGIFHLTQRRAIFGLLSRITYQEILMVQGVEGSEDLYVHRPSVLWKVTRDHTEEITINPGEMGLMPTINRINLSPSEQAQAILHIISGNPHPLRDLVVYNAGVRLWFSRCTSTWQQGVELARYLLDTGQAQKILQRWQAWKPYSD